MRVLTPAVLIGLSACAATGPPSATPNPDYRPSSIALYEADDVATACGRAEIPTIAVARGRALNVDDRATLDAVAECLVAGPLRDSVIGVSSGADATAMRIKAYLVARGADARRIVTGVQQGASTTAADIQVLTPAARAPMSPETLPSQSPGRRP